MNHLVDELHNYHKSWSKYDVGESRIVEDVSVPYEIASIVDDTSIDSCLSPSSLDEVHVSLEDTREVNDVMDEESSIPITNEIYVQEDNQIGQETQIKSIVITPIVSSSSESLEFLAMLHQISCGVFSCSECLNFSPEFLQNFAWMHIC